MKLNREEGGSQSIFSDMLFSVLMTFILAFFFVMLLVNPKAIPDANVKRDANWLIEVSWPDDIDCDVDLWVRDPTKKVVWFRNKADGVMAIERDDQGVSSDTMLDATGQIVKVTENLEVWTLRGKLNGEYIANVHLYNCKEASGKIGAPAKVPVTMKIIQVNPRYSVRLTRTKTLDRVWQEVTMSKFEIFDNADKVRDLGDEFIGVVRLPQGETLK